MSQLPMYTGGYQIPGMNTVLEGVENQFWWGEIGQQIWLGDTLSGAARDAGNTVTTLLRTGLLLGKITATGLLKEWNPTGTDGSQDIYGILGGMVHAQQNGANQQRYVGFVMVGGNVYSDRIIIPANAAEGIVGDALEFAVLQQLGRRFLFDRHLTMLDPRSLKPRPMTAAEIAADAITVTTADHGRTFTFVGGDGATAVTLPEPQVGLTFHFVNLVSQTITLDMTTGKFVTPGSITQDTISLTVGEQVTLTGLSTTLYRAQITEAATD